MKFSEDNTQAHYRITAYNANTVQVNKQILRTPFLISGQQLISDWDCPSLEKLTPTHLTEFMQNKFEVLIIGTGQQHIPLSIDMLHFLVESRSSFEVMATDAACRTFNILLSEQRATGAIIFL